MAFWDDLLKSVGAEKDKLLHGVWRSSDMAEIGWFETDADLAAQHIHLYPGMIAGPPETWVVQSGLGYDVAADAYLIAKGLQPSWLQPGGVITRAVATGVGPAGTLEAFGVPTELPQLPQLPALPGIATFAAGGSAGLAEWALIGAFGLLALALIVRAEA